VSYLTNKAYLITFSLTTRVVAEDEDKAEILAAEKIIDQIFDHTRNEGDLMDSVLETEEDYECPYGTFDDD